MAEIRTPSVKIEQPPTNKATAIAIAVVAGFFGVVFLTQINAGVFNLMLIMLLAGVLLFAYKAIQVIAIADAEGIEVRNLIRRARIPWTKIDTLTVGAAGSENALGITIDLKDRSTMAIEASSGPWYHKTLSDETVARCEEFVERIDKLRRNAANAAEQANLDAAASLTVRATVVQDADGVAETINDAWHETYAEILPGYKGFERDPADDADMLRELLDGSIEGAGSFVVERSGTIVGASVFGPTHGEGIDGYVEIFMLYVRADEIGGDASRCLVLRTFGAIRASGAAGIVGHVQVDNRRFRSQIERMGIDPHGEPMEQIWHGLPVRVVEYRLAF
ncbi:MAG: hypothetical protein M3112_05255 [Actinomycetia bacterium]|nr:hypothetical protein [Actinomycetes bacterium]